MSPLPTNSECLPSCNDMNLPFMNAESFYIGTSDHSTGSDDSLYQEELWQIARDLSDVGSPEQFRGAQLPPEAEHMRMQSFRPPPCPPSGHYEFRPAPKGIPPIPPDFSGVLLPASSSGEPNILIPTLQWMTEGTIQANTGQNRIAYVVRNGQFVLGTPATGPPKPPPHLLGGQAQPASCPQPVPGPKKAPPPPLPTRDPEAPPPQRWSRANAIMTAMLESSPEPKPPPPVQLPGDLPWTDW